MKNRYFDRDLSWLSFNYRVLQESRDSKLPLYERIKFLAIYASNLEEFYKVRVAEHRSILAIDTEELAGKSVDKAAKTLNDIHEEVTRQQADFTDVFTNIIKPELGKNKIILSRPDKLDKEQIQYISNYFNNEILPFLQPVMVKEGEIYSFLRDNRVYVTVCMYKKNDIQQQRPKFAALKIPISKVSRFIPLPERNGEHHILFLEDAIKMNLKTIFPGYNIECTYTIHVSRNADLMIEDELDGNLVNKITRSLSRRKTGVPSRFVYEHGMPSNMVKVIRHAFNIHKTDVVEGGYHLALQDLFTLPNPLSSKLESPVQGILPVKALEHDLSIFKAIKTEDIILHYPYHSYDYLIRFLMEAALDPSVEEIMATQYRVAHNSAVVNSLINAAQNGKKVTVFVELKARFDEQHNLYMAAQMEKAGIKIIYSIPNLKVHAKVALVIRKGKGGQNKTSFAYLSTGNFNEKTARVYSDFGLFTCEKEIINDLKHLFLFLNDTDYKPIFSSILVTQFNLVPEMIHLIDDEIDAARKGKKAHIIVKMNSLQDPIMIDKLYEASQAGVKIEMLIRGICCLVPGEEFSKNITITRIVGHYLEHARIWYFHANDSRKLYMGSADWMKRNLYKRIETIFPINNTSIKEKIIHYLQLELDDNTKGTFINNKLKDISKEQGDKKVHSQYDMYDFWKNVLT